MALIKPFITTKFTAYAGETITTTLSLAVLLLDEFTMKKPEGKIEVLIVEGRRERKPARNLSGYFCFNNLLPNSYTVVVRPDPVTSDWFLGEERVIAIPRPDHLNPVAEFILKTKPSYPFPPNANLIRGIVVENPNAKPLVPVVDAVVTASAEFIDPNNLPQTVTDRNGEFALFLKEVELNDDDPFIKKITLTIEKNGIPKEWIIDTMKEGTTFNLKRIKFRNAN